MQQVQDGVYVSDDWGRIVGYRNSLVDRIKTVQTGQFMNKATKSSKPKIVMVSKKKTRSGAIPRITV